MVHKRGNLTKKDWNDYAEIIGKATRNELDELDNSLKKEIRLSEISIKEGFEKRR